MMHIGLNICGGITDEDWPLCEELGITWIKLNWDVEIEDLDELVRRAERERERGLTIVIDLRIVPTELNPYYQQFHKETMTRWTEVALYRAGYDDRQIALFFKNEPRYGQTQLWQWALGAWEERRGEDEVRRANIIQTQTRENWLKTMDVLGEMTNRIAERLNGLVLDWEIQGEFTCPVVMRNSFSDYDYTLHLATSALAIREAIPEARIWTGGSGVQLGIGWLKSMLTPADDPVFPTGGPPGVAQRSTIDAQIWFPEGVSQYFDICNWHHYGHTSAQLQDFAGLDLEDQIPAYNELFAEAGHVLDKLGRGQPFASTEWGFPVIADKDMLPGELKQHSQEWIERLESLGKHEEADNCRKINQQYRYSSDLYWGGVIAVRESRSAEWMERCLQCFSEWNFQVMCIHNLRDAQGDKPGGGLEFWGNRCGLIDLEGNKRPTFEVVQKYAQEARDSEKPAFQGLQVAR